jgi:hypothetical protein
MDANNSPGNMPATEVAVEQVVTKRFFWLRGVVAFAVVLVSFFPLFYVQRALGLWVYF